MAILVGIDEAGYGPILGPLTVSAAAFRLPDELLGKPLWDILRRSVCKKVAGSAGRLAIHDSKKIHRARKDYSLLQRGVLGALMSQNDRETPRTLTDLLQTLDVGSNGRMERYPWYGRAAEMPLRFDTDDLVMAAAALREDMQNAGMGLLGLRAVVLLEGEFNEMVGKARNKALVLFGLVSRHIDHAFGQYGARENNLQILVDRLGGRCHYREQLQRLYPSLELKILKESDKVSSYLLADKTRQFKIHFLTKGDDAHLPIALASMTSKYLRELFMEVLNEWFVQKCPGLKPTAGYYKDGQRFLQDMQEYKIVSDLPQHLLVRQR